MSHTAPPTAPAEPSAAALPPSYDPLLTAAIEASKSSLPEILDLQHFRGGAPESTAEDVLNSYPGLEHREYCVPATKATGGHSFKLAVFTSRTSTRTNRPALYHIHGGGQVAGNRFTALKETVDYFDGIDAVFVSVEYRLAPEHRAPAALEDAYAGLVWTAEHAAELGLDASKIVVLRLFRRLSDSGRSHNAVPPGSWTTFARDGPWCGTTNRMAWDLVLGEVRGGQAVSRLVSPAHATDLTGMPPTFIDAGACEVFRDEAVAFTSRLWESGVNAELHVWPGGYHGFDMLTPDVPVSAAAGATKTSWVKRLVGELGRVDSSPQHGGDIG